MSGPLQAILPLQTALDELKAAEEQLSGIPEWMEELHVEHSQQLAEIAALEQAVEEARAERRKAEGEIADAQEKLKRYQQQINLVSTQREYGALLQEIDTTKTQIQTSENEGLEAMERREQAEKELEDKRQAFAELDQRYKRELEKWNAEKPAVAERVERLQGTVQTLRERLSAGVLRQFDRLFERHGGEPLAAIRRVESVRGTAMWHCGACNYRVRPQSVVEIRNSGSIVLCDACKRVLYQPADEDGEE
jgi:hypothetical protein